MQRSLENRIKIVVFAVTVIYALIEIYIIKLNIRSLENQKSCVQQKPKPVHKSKQEEFEDTKGVIGIRKSKKDRQKDKQRFTKHYK